MSIYHRLQKVRHCFARCALLIGGGGGLATDGMGEHVRNKIVRGDGGCTNMNCSIFFLPVLSTFHPCSKSCFCVVQSIAHLDTALLPERPERLYLYVRLYFFAICKIYQSLV